MTTRLTPAQLNDVPTLRRLREAAPVHHVDLGRGGAEWLLTGYEAAVTGFADQRLAGGGAAGNPIEEADKAGRVIFEEDLVDLSGEDHQRVRRMISRQLTPRRVAALLPRIERITGELLDAIPPAESVDFIAAFARPLPIMTLCALIGVPDADRAYVQAYVSGRIATLPERPEAVTPGPDMTSPETAAMVAHLGALIAERRREPADDLVSGMIRQADREGLPDAYLVAGVRLTLVAGHRAVTALLANGLALLLREPGLWRLLLERPELVGDAVEELLRYVTPIALSVPRHATAAVEVCGAEVPDRAVVRCAWGAANRDPARFAEPDAFDPARPDNAHLAFGYGHHFCLGAALARAEIGLALTTLLARFPRMRLVEEELDYRSGDLREPRTLRVVLSPPG
ncbi:cytochrome P450 [Nonomuraea endophytica]|uniref:Cytochrome P450 n=1 Tax=Nonomuraea endophytica TaxID=714136 RepID=A0A7W8EMQ3_9ACTN|nr:cytochrome P450 [Nonomuraea endophytica]MBB5084192.1 cytochrome P450 [Nonomuraea endophytica]